MSSKYMLEQLHRHTANGYPVTVAESLMNDTIRLTYQTRPVAALWAGTWRGRACRFR